MANQNQNQGIWGWEGGSKMGLEYLIMPVSEEVLKRGGGAEECLECHQNKEASLKGLSMAKSGTI